MRPRRALLAAALPLLLVAGLPGAGVADSRPERLRISVGLAGATKSYLPLYLARERTAQAEGLDLELVLFQGGSRAAAALASGSIDVAVASLDTVVSTMRDRPVKVFYGGFSHPDFEWFAAPALASWDALRGRTLAVSAPGALTDFLTRHVLRKRGLEREVHLVSTGSPAVRWQALRAGRVDAAILQTPHKWHAEAEGFTRLGAQVTEIAGRWPSNVMFAREEFLTTHGAVVRAFLRAHVRALRLARRERSLAVGVLRDWLKYEPPDAERTYDEAMPGFDERGTLPADVMPLFWEIVVSTGEVTARWPESRFLDRRFMDTFETWAPR
jgi:NitT/TauT family transport system substrate-binding protein